MAADQGAEKTEEATERRIQKYRDEGRLATSRELISAVSLGVGVLAGGLMVSDLLQGIVSVARASLDRAVSGQLALADFTAIVRAAMIATGPGILAFLIPAASAALLTGLLLTQFNVTTEPLAFKWERLDVFSNFSSQFLSATPWVGIAKSCAITGVILWSVYSAVNEQLRVLPAASHWAAQTQLRFLGWIARNVFERAIPMTLLIGVADFVYQKWKMSQQMMMTHQEVKEEHKDSEGDPLIKQRRRQRARQIVLQKQMGDVPRADVVVTNPTHYAVALRYRKEENAAPVILARGLDLVALQIRAAASRNDVPIVENRPLARALAAKGRVGSPVPKELYGPVAKVLAAVYRRRK